MEAIIVDDGRKDVKTAESLLREYMRAHLEEVAARFGVQVSVADALAADFALMRDAEQQDWGMLVAWDGTVPLGCVVLQALPEDAVELKRLYVRPQWRRGGIGRFLLLSAMAAARMAGATTFRLNTHDMAAPALGLYESVGFLPAPPYAGSAIPPEHHDSWVFMEWRAPAPAES